VIATTVGFREAQRAPGELGNSAIWQLGNPGDRQRIVRSRNWESADQPTSTCSPRGEPSIVRCFYQTAGWGARGECGMVGGVNRREVVGDGER
jgi:hypothetical protein